MRNQPLFEHIVNVSGGKDSDCCYLLALERGRPFRALFADTGHEHPLTYEHVERLAQRTGGPPVEWIKADFSAAIARRRERLPGQWAENGIPQSLIDRALELLHPTGIPYLDLVLSKGMFAAGVSRKFCTEHLKVIPSDQQVVKPALAAGISIIQWLGIRRDESETRVDAKRLEMGRPVLMDAKMIAWARKRGEPYPRPRLIYARPLVDWTVENVVAYHRHHGLPMNPLYGEGFSRVGCFPCINEQKNGLAIIARRFPEAVEKLREWEKIVTATNVAWKNENNRHEPRDVCTFFPAGKVSGMARNTVDDVMNWATTKRGGRQHDLFAGTGAEQEIGDEKFYTCETEGYCE